ncbi:MAG: hypothetical protein K2X49_02625 [Acetobacteraceae bacterium]|nr:hypothetical protein [Acetobacteraceae bacterium]
MSDESTHEEVAALRQQIADLRKALFQVALSEASASLALAEILRRIESDSFLRASLSPQGKRGFPSMPLDQLRDRIHSSADILFDVLA